MNNEHINTESIEFFFEDEPFNILLNNLSSYNETPEKITNLITDIENIGTDEQKEHLNDLQRAIQFQIQNKRFPTLEELNHNTEAPILKTDKTCVKEAYEEICNNLKREEYIKEFRLAWDSKDSEKITTFANKLLVPKLSNTTDISKVLDIRALRSCARKNNSFIKTGIEIFDKLTYGFQNKTINTISAPSSGGKTTFAVNVAYNNALEGKIVVYFALESSADEILSLLLSTAYKHKSKQNSKYLFEECEAYNNHETRTEFKAGTVNSIKFFKLSEKIDDLLIDNYQNEIMRNSGQIYVIDDSLCDLRSVGSLTNILEDIAEKENRKVDIVVIDNADELTSFDSDEKHDADMTAVNKMINQLNIYSTKHCNGKGTTILFLAQLNREGIKELAKTKPILNLTHISTYSNLYTKANIVAALSKDKTTSYAMNFSVLKNRHGKITSDEELHQIYTVFEYCYIDNTQIENHDKNNTITTNTDLIDDESLDIFLADDEFEESELMV